MGSLPPFTLIYESQSATDSAKVQADKDVLGEAVQRPSRKNPADIKISSKIQKKLNSVTLNPQFHQAILSAAKRSPDVDSQYSNIKSVIDDLKREKKVTTIALWDLEARIGKLPDMIRVLNEAQPILTFFELQGAPLPAALVGRQEFMVNWLRKNINRGLKRTEKEAVEDNLNSNDFYDGAEAVRKIIGVDYLVGITPFMIAGDEGDVVFWNHFSDYRGRILLTSTHGLQDYANRAGRPFEVGLATLIIGILMVRINRRLRYHDGEDTGCIFDFKENRDSIVEELRQLKVDDDCLKKCSPSNRKALIAMLDGLKQYDIAEPEPVEEAGGPIDNDYWIAQLDSLSEAG